MLGSPGIALSSPNKAPGVCGINGPCTQVPGEYLRYGFLVTFGRWVFGFQHRLPGFGALSSFWAGMTQWRGKKLITDRSNDELYLCVELLQLLFHQCAMRIARRSFAAHAS